MRATLSLLLVLALTGGPHATVGEPAGLTLTLAVDWRTRTLPRSCLTAVVDEAAAIWAPYGVRCRRADKAEVTVIVDDELPVFLAQSREEPLGWLLFTEGCPDPVLHASAVAAERLVTRARFAGRSAFDLPIVLRDRLTARALGRAIAHEIGHYVLASPAHTPRGLMRASFSAMEATAEEREGFSLDAAQRVSLHRRP
jgi:hypothetical protein